MLEKNFDSGFSGEYKGYHIDSRLISIPNITSPIVLKLHKLQKSPYFNTIQWGIELYETIVYLNELITDIYQSNINKGIISNNFLRNEKKERVIHIMKRVIDNIITLLFIFRFDKIENLSQIELSCIGDLYSNKKKNLATVEKVKKDINFCKFNPLFSAINDLHNAYKHSCFYVSSHRFITTEGVALQSYYCKHNNLKDIEYLNHNFMHIVISFSDFLLEFCNVENCLREPKINVSENEFNLDL